MISGRVGSLLRSAAVITSFALGCSASSPPRPDLATGTTAAPAAVVELRPITIAFRGAPIARLFADGRTESAGASAPGSDLVAGPSLHADGTITLTRPGATARLDAAGDIYVTTSAAPGEALVGRITGDHFTFAGSDRPWSVRVEDDLVWFSETDNSQIEGVVTPGVRHTVLVMAAAFYIEGALAAP